MDSAAGWQPRYAERAARLKASEIRELLKLLDRPEIVSFAGGIPDPALFPIEAARAAYAECLGSETAGRALQYSVSEGYLPLRQWIAGYLGRLGVACAPDNILVTSGSQQALEFLGKLLISPGDTALVSAPTYLGALQAFSGAEPVYDELRPEDGNRTAAAYADAAAASGQVKLAYVVPDFANPTGETLSRPARERLLDLVAELDIPLIEDTAYSALRFGGQAHPCLQALDVARSGSIDHSRVILCGTFSKTLSPGLRIGWICAAEPIVRRLVLIKQAADLNSSLLNQMVMHRLAETTFDGQVSRARVHYASRRDAMLDALGRHMPAGVRWTRPDGGLFVWLTLPEALDGSALLERAVGEIGVAFVPGAAFFPDGRGLNAARLSYSLPPKARIDDGIARLGRLIAGDG
ncbi:MAG: PLP-dependent aminotransferase family protein [Hyphomicrobiaceae bacterium]|nr:PLP-dependent aminotransferase family protein [Hyphomicrobiaceae bacterium]